MPRNYKLLLPAVALTLAASNASATWSILIADTRTGEIVIGSATCLESFDLRRETPVLITGVGAVTAQSAVDGSGLNRMLIRDRLLQGVPLESILEELSNFDAGHLNRQYGFISTTGDSLGETLTYSGIQNADFAGGITGRIERGQPGPADDIIYTVQGNILSGENVVQGAVDAIVQSAADDSDLPGMLMSGMQAARMEGGDGRCSCSSGNPTGCGSPPPEPFKSAHIAYMLGARTGDIDAARAFYPITNNAGGMALLDIDHDGMNDVVIGDAINNELNVFINSANPGDPLSHVMLDRIVNLGASGVVAMSASDLNNDGLMDVAVALSAPPTLALLLGQESGVLSEPITHPLLAAPTGLKTAKLNAGSRDKIIVSQGSIDTVQFFTILGDQITQAGPLNIAGNPTAIMAADVVGNSELDLIIARRDDNTVWIGQNVGKDGFIEAANIPTANEPHALATHDLDNDGDQEIVVLSNSGRRVEIFIEDAGIWTRTNEIIINRDGQGLAIGDFNNDSLPDILTTSSSPQRNLQLFTNDGKGGFPFDHTVKVGRDAQFIALSDMNANGNLDVVVANSGDTGLNLIDNPRGSLMPPPSRFADGDYFLEFNIANQRTDDPDPVDQMTDLFAQWRSGLEGKVDAVRSAVQSRTRLTPNQSTTITVNLRDWHNELLPITDASSLSAISSNTRLIISDATLVSPGIFTFDTSAHPELLGTGSLRFIYDDGTNHVELMPTHSIDIVENIADFTNDGQLNYFDLSAFAMLFIAQSIDADLNDDGFISNLDVVVFLAELAG